MNKARRQQLHAAIAEIDVHVSVLKSLLEREQAALDNLPSSLQESESAESMQDAIDNLQEVIDDIDLDPIRLL